MANRIHRYLEHQEAIWLTLLYHRRYLSFIITPSGFSVHKKKLLRLNSMTSVAFPLVSFLPNSKKFFNERKMITRITYPLHTHHLVKTERRRRIISIIDRRMVEMFEIFFFPLQTKELSPKNILIKQNNFFFCFVNL